MDYSYDLESYPNLFSIGFMSDTDYHKFEISTRRNDIIALQQFIHEHGDSAFNHIGFNNVGFDYPIVHALVNCNPWEQDPLAISYDLCQKIIGNRERFNPYSVYEREHRVSQIDLYKLNHYDNQAKRTSLKQLEFAMRMESIIDLPYAPGSYLTSEQMDVTIEYMHHDIKATHMFGKENTWAIDLRQSLSETYNRNMLNMSESAIGSHIFQFKLNEAGIETHDYVDEWSDEEQKVVRKREPRGTHRPSINLGSVVFPYISFERPEFKAVLAWLHETTIKQTKGALSDIAYHPELFKYVNPEGVKITDLPLEDCQGKFKPVKNRKTRLSTALNKGVELDLSKYENVTSDNLNVVINGFQFDLGTGGIHGSVESQIVHSDDEYVILDYDFASYYPHLSFKNGVYPQHLGSEFCDVYESMYFERKSYPKSNPINHALKIALNGSYGNSNSKYSFLYDPRFTMTITINGQLLLCMLAEQFLKVPGLDIIQVNTDGITVRSPRIYHEHVRDVVKWIEQVSNIEMEEAIYSRMIIRDVNNYIAEYDGSGKLKRKGAYSWSTKFHNDKNGVDLGWHQNHSSLIVGMAAEAALVRGEDVRAFIENHTDIFDFMIMVKVNRTDQLYWSKEEIQRISRVYASNTGQHLFKEMPPLKGKTDKRRMGMIVGQAVSIANDMNDADFDDIDYDFYVAEAEKLVNPLLKR